MEDNSRIVIDPNVCGGKPCVHGTRIMVTSLLGMFAGGYTVKRILRAYPELVQEDISAALEYAGRVVDGDKVIARS